MNQSLLNSYEEVSPNKVTDLIASILSNQNHNITECKRKYFKIQNKDQVAKILCDETVIEIGRSRFIHKSCQSSDDISELEREQESSRNNLKRKLVEVISSDSELVTDSDIFNISQTVINNALEYKANGTNKKRSAKCPTCKKKYNSTEVSSHKCGPCNFTYGCNNECRLIHTGSVADSRLHISIDKEENMKRTHSVNIEKVINKILDKNEIAEPCIIIIVENLKQHRENLVAHIEKLVWDVRSLKSFLSRLCDCMNSCRCDRSIVTNLIAQYQSKLPAGRTMNTMVDELISLKHENGHYCVVVQTAKRLKLKLPPKLCVDQYFILCDFFDWQYFKEANSKFITNNNSLTYHIYE